MYSGKPNLSIAAIRRTDTLRNARSLDTPKTEAPAHFVERADAVRQQFVVGSGQGIHREDGVLQGAVNDVRLQFGACGLLERGGRSSCRAGCAATGLT